MVKCQYCTPEWLEETARIYRSDPSMEDIFLDLMGIET